MPCLATGTPQAATTMAARGRDVPGARGIAAGAAGVDRAGGRSMRVILARMARTAPVISLDGLAAHAQRHQEAAHLRRRGVAGHHDVESLLGLRRGQRLAGRRDD